MANEFKVKKGLIAQGSGSTILDVQGSQGQLFSVTDNLSGSLFSVNDISGVPIMEVFSDDTINMGTFGAEAIKVSGSFATMTGSLFGTASWADNATTASYALTASSTTAIAGTTNYVPKFIASETLGNSQIYDNGTNVGIGTTSPSYSLEVSGNLGIQGDTLFFRTGIGGSQTLKIGAPTIAGSSLVNRYLSISTNSTGVTLQANGSSTSNLSLRGDSTIYMQTSAGFIVTINSSGNVGIGTTTPSSKLDVNGNAIITGSLTVTNGVTGSLFGTASWAQNVPSSSLTGSFVTLDTVQTITGAKTFTPTANTTPLTISGYSLTGSNTQPLLDLSGTWNTTGTPTAIRANVTDTASNANSLLMDLQVGGTSQFRVLKSGAINTRLGNYVGQAVSSTAGFITMDPISLSSTPSSNFNVGVRFTDFRSTTSPGFSYLFSSVQYTDLSYTSSLGGYMLIQRGFAPTSGTGVFNVLTLQNTINQTGGANGITRGLYINPTLTSAADWRSIELTNNTGFGIYQSGTANNSFAGNVGIGTTTPSAKLDVNGTTNSTTFTTNGASITGHPFSGLQVFCNSGIANDFTLLSPGIGSNIMTVPAGTTNSIFYGNVGIGTTTPSAKLDVNGNAIITGSLTVTNGVTGSLFGTASWADNAIDANDADRAASVLIVNDTSTNATYYPAFMTATSGHTPVRVDNTGLTYNPSSNTLTAGTFVGNLTGNASSADEAGKIYQNDTGGGGEFLIPMADQTVGNYARLYNTSNLADPVYYKVDNATLYSKFFSGELSGNAATATTATNINATANNSTNETTYITFVDGATGAQGIETDTDLTYNPATNVLTAGTFSGNNIVAPSIEIEANTAGIYFDGGDLAVGDFNGNGYSTTFYGQGGTNLLSLASNYTQYYSPIVYTNPQGTSEVNGEVAYWGGGSVTAGNLYYYDSSGNWTAADANTASTSTGMLGIARATGTASSVGMLLRGRARFTANGNYTALSTIGAPLYISTTAGGFTQTAPSGTGDVVRIIGYVQSTTNDEIYFCPDNTWVEIA